MTNQMAGGWGGGAAAGTIPTVPVGYFGGGMMNSTIGSQPGLGKVLALSESHNRSKLEMLAMTSRMEGVDVKFLDANSRLHLGDRFATLPDDWTEADTDSGRVLLSRGVPLGELVTQHIGSQRKFACLTQYGVHHLLKGTFLHNVKPNAFAHHLISNWHLGSRHSHAPPHAAPHHPTLDRPIDVLCRKLQTAKHVGNTEVLTEFFRYFGQKQACAMCYTLASGLPCDLAAPIDEITRVLDSPDFGGKPKTQTVQTTNTNFVIQDTSDNKLSPKFEGFAIAVSRLLRPVWLTPLVVLKGNWDHNPSTRNGEPPPAGRWGEHVLKPAARKPDVKAKAPLLLSHSEMEELMAPMRHLITFARSSGLWKEEEIVEALRNSGSFYAPGPKSPTHAAADAMAMGGGLASGYLAGLKGTEVPNEKIVKAKQNELRKFFGTYRLLLRSYQALIMLSRLEQVHHDYKIKVGWEKLNGMSLRDLVVEKEANTEVNKLLSTLVQPKGNKDCLTKDAAEELSDFLKRECSLYYEKGEQLYFDAKKLISVANACTDESGRREASDNAIEALCRAARYWTKPGIVKDHEGNLYTACKDLQALGRPDGVVQLCLACARNFSDRSDQFSLSLASDERFGGMTAPGSRLQFDINGLHSMESAAQWAAAGLSKGEKDLEEQDVVEARYECWNLVIETLESMQRPENLVGPNVNPLSTAPGLSPLYQVS